MLYDRFFFVSSSGLAVFVRAMVLGAFMTMASDVSAQSDQVSGNADSSWAPETFMLDNGMQVVVLPDHRAPVVTHMVWYRVGAADEPPGKSGLAHFLEHLMFKGTERVPPGELSKIVARNGGQDNAFTSLDYTGYFQRVALDRLPLVMELESDRMTNLILSDDIVNPERGVVLEERSSRTDNNPESLLSEQMNAALFMSHPYRIPIIGWEHEIRSLTTQDALAFYRRHYAPNNAILVVAGDITAGQLKPLAEKYYGTIPAAQVEPRIRPKEPPAVAPRRIDYLDPRVRQPSLRRTYLGPSYSTAEEGEAEALDVLAQILGVGPTSRLYRLLVVESALAVSAGAYYSGGGLDYGRFGIYATPRADITLEQLEEAIDGVLAALLVEGIDEKEVTLAKSNFIADAIYARDSQQSLAQSYGAGLTTGLTVKDITEFPDRIERVTVEAVERAAQGILNNPAQVTGFLRPEPAS